MLEIAVTALANLCTPLYFLLLLVGIFLGLGVGLIPGLGGVTALALILPFAMKLDAGAALPLVMGLVSPILTSDAIPAILIGSPGSPSAAATMMDGFPMSQKGEAGKALGSAFTASAMGGILGSLVIVICIPILRPLVLLLDTPDFLALCILAISAVSVLGGRNVLKGIGAAGIGLLISMIGADPTRFVVRWNFGISYLIEPIHIIPVALGLFAIPEILTLCVKGTSVAQVPQKELGGRFEGFKAAIKNWKLVASSSVIGSFFGFLPGLGSMVSSWLCYSWTIIISKDKSSFGKGEVRGVIGVEGAVNASANGSLIPTIAFGIPGSAVTALILVTFWAVGISPGPKLLTERVDLVFLIVWSVALANIIGALICYALANKLTMITRISPHILAPIALTIIFTGTLYNTSDIEGLILLLVFSFLGWIMKSFDWSRPAFLLSFILGPLIEKFYFHSTMMYDSVELITRPSVIIILVCACGIIYLGMTIERKVSVKRESG